MRAVWVIALLLLAGCSDSSAPAEDDELVVPDAKPTSGKGAISGVVVTETIQPVADAVVRLEGQGMETTSDPKGGFVFNDVVPGVYFVTVSAAGFNATQTSVTVEAGAVAKARILLPADRTPQPYKVTQHFQGHMVVSDYAVVWQATTLLGNNPMCECYFEFGSDPGVRTLVIEAVWESSTLRVEEHDMWWDVWGGNGYDGQWVLSEETWHAEGDQFGAEATEWAIQISSGEQPDVEQDFEGFLTFWHVQKAPPEWSFIRGDP